MKHSFKVFRLYPRNNGVATKGIRKGVVRESTNVPFRRFLGDMRREFMERLFVVLHGTLVLILVMPLKRMVQVLLLASLPRGLNLLCLSPLYSPLLFVGSAAFVVISEYKAKELSFIV
jgi:hypothetical protein